MKTDGTKISSYGEAAKVLADFLVEYMLKKM